jgi:hypothetical protein
MNCALRLPSRIHATTFRRNSSPVSPCTVADNHPAKMVQSRISKPSAHQLRAYPMAQNTHLKKENKFPLLAMKMKIYLHKL